MRTIAQERPEEVTDISAQFSMAHGAPVHWGDPAVIGISNIAEPDWGDAAPVANKEAAVLWACDVNPQVAIIQAGPPICITYKPGQILITDIVDI